MIVFGGKQDRSASVKHDKPVYGGLLASKARNYNYVPLISNYAEMVTIMYV